MRRHAIDASPREACGLLLGTAEGDAWRLVEALPVDNAAERDDRFEIPATEVLAAMRRAREIGTELLGAYHSHPGGGPSPSATDARAAWGGWVYLILGDGSGRDAGAFAEVAAWCWRGARFDRTELRVTGGR